MIEKQPYENHFIFYRSDGPGPYEMETYEGMGPKGYKRRDALIEEEVCEMLAQDSLIDASDINVSVEDGVVKLTGVLCNRDAKFYVEDIVETILGVHFVQNEIHIARVFNA